MPLGLLGEILMLVMKLWCSMIDLELPCRLRGLLGLVIALSCAMFSGCRHDHGGLHSTGHPASSIETDSPSVHSSTTSTASSTVLMLLHVESDTLQNLIQISDRVYSGGEPHGEDAFRELAALGIQTVLSVDGAKPDLIGAKRQGLRYVHVPIGYDGVETHSALSIVQLMRESEGKIYVHCHHGRHRGPVAAAIACMADGQVGPEAGLSILEVAGTSRDYAGLWRDVAAFRPPDADVILPELTEVARVGDLAESMAKMDRVFDRLTLLSAHQWQPPDSHEDLDARQEAIILRELLHECGRLLDAGAAKDLYKRFDHSEKEAGALENALEAGYLERSTNLLGQIKTSCKSCHQQHRNDPGH
jgi:protein tyrosine phosphatase (PTP) superfamily phosphohydrolase (DUF442 family)